MTGAGSLDDDRARTDGAEHEASEPQRRSLGDSLSLRERTLATLLGAALIPLVGYAGGVTLIRSMGPDVPGGGIGEAVLLMFVGACVSAILVAFLFSNRLLKPYSEFLSAIGRDGQGHTPIEAQGDDEVAALARRFNQLLSAVDRRDEQTVRVQEAIARLDGRLASDALRERIGEEARSAFDLLSTEVVVGPVDPPSSAVVPGEPRPVWSILRLGADQLGLLSGHVSAMRTWESDDQLRFELFATAAALAVRSAGKRSGPQS